MDVFVPKILEYIVKFLCMFLKSERGVHWVCQKSQGHCFQRNKLWSLCEINFHAVIQGINRRENVGKFSFFASTESFAEKLLIFWEKSNVFYCEIFSEDYRLAYVLDVSILWLGCWKAREKQTVHYQQMQASCLIILPWPLGCLKPKNFFPH
jgi:hypothetical protein